VYTDSREGWIKAINHSPEKARPTIFWHPVTTGL